MVLVFRWRTYGKYSGDKKVFADADISEYSGLIEKYGDDERDGVKKIDSVRSEKDQCS